MFVPNALVNCVDVDSCTFNASSSAALSSMSATIRGGTGGVPEYLNVASRAFQA